MVRLFEEFFNRSAIQLAHEVLVSSLLASYVLMTDSRTFTSGQKVGGGPDGSWVLAVSGFSSTASSEATVPLCCSSSRVGWTNGDVRPLFLAFRSASSVFISSTLSFLPRRTCDRMWRVKIGSAL